MFRLQLAVPALCASLALSAQTGIDLNGLASAAGHYVSRGLQGQHNPPSLELRMIRGDNGGHPDYLMTRASDVVRYTVFYSATYKHALDEEVVPPKSASVKCIRGTFSDFHLSAPPIPETRSMEDTWLAFSLDAAIAQLNAHGYVRGFSRVETRRPDSPELPDEPVYIFTCPWERTNVAISANTGALAWYRIF